MKNLPIAFLLLPLLLLFLAGCGGEEPADPPAEAVQVSVEDFRYNQLPGGARILTGRLLNPTPQAIKSAQIRVALFDADNRLLSTMNIIVRDVPPGEAKAFREAVDSDEVDGAKVRGVLLL